MKSHKFIWINILIWSWLGPPLIVYVLFLLEICNWNIQNTKKLLWQTKFLVVQDETVFKFTVLQANYNFLVFFFCKLRAGSFTPRWFFSKKKVQLRKTKTKITTAWPALEDIPVQQVWVLGPMGMRNSEISSIKLVCIGGTMVMSQHHSFSIKNLYITFLNAWKTDEQPYAYNKLLITLVKHFLTLQTLGIIIDSWLLEYVFFFSHYLIKLYL